MFYIAVIQGGRAKANIFSDKSLFFFLLIAGCNNHCSKLEQAEFDTQQEVCWWSLARVNEEACTRTKVGLC